MTDRSRDVEAVLREANKGPGWRWPLIIGIGTVLVAVAVWYWGGGRGTSNAVEYITEPVDRGDIMVLVTATGTVQPTNQVQISSEISGTIRSIDFDFNDPVKAGDVLARLDTQSLEANLTRSRANVAVAEARITEADVTLEETRAAYERATQLEEKGLSSKQAFLSAKALYDRAVAAKKSAEANLEIANAGLALDEANLAKACICSPIDGVVLERNVEVGQIVAASFSAPVLFTVAEDLSRMQLEVDVDEADIGQVAVGNKATFTVEAFHDTTFPAVIAELRYAPLTVNGVVTYKAMLDIDNAELLLRPGMTATADIVVAERQDVLRVPNAALRFTPDVTLPPATGRSSGRTVWVLRDGQPSPVSITTGATDETHAEVIAGDITVGDVVIVGSGSS